MPKQRSNSAAKKRFNVLPSGKVKRAQQNKSHNLNSALKRRKQKRNLRKGAYVANSAEAKTVRKLVQK